MNMTDISVAYRAAIATIKHIEAVVCVRDNGRKADKLL